MVRITIEEKSIDVLAVEIFAKTEVATDSAMNRVLKIFIVGSGAEKRVLIRLGLSECIFYTANGFEMYRECR